MTAELRSARLFAAVAFDPAEKRELARAAQTLRGACDSGRFPPEALLHITLHFFGQTSLGKLPAIEEAMRRVAGGASVFSLTTGHAGTFGRAGASVLWLGLDRGADKLRALHASLEAALGEAGFPLETREFKAHITLGRDVRMNASAASIAVPPVSLAVRGITLMESTTVSGRLDYVPLITVPFPS